MGRTIAAVVAGYATMFVCVFASFSLAYALLGADRSFQPGTYAVSNTWIVISFVLGFGAALAGGIVCRRIGRTRAAVRSLAALVIVLGAAMAAMSAQDPSDPAAVERSGDVPNAEAMQKAQPPLWVTLLTPLVGAAGVVLGGRRT